ncbi:hypothetical protein J2S34_003808 [Nitrobacter winogradskyi]|uniref:Uncharacterized protein n=1 Tax=Nitrobacter winogradskyi TaxID=913 RepID=A0ACC6AP20_NITWI|nr:hypothetical protein [Nitrobacter winogradskyi]
MRHEVSPIHEVEPLPSELKSAERYPPPSGSYEAEDRRQHQQNNYER